MGVSLAYIRSPHFLKGDGGIANVVWVDGKLHDRMCGFLSPGQKVAAEKDVRSMEDLRRFVAR